MRTLLMSILLFAGGFALAPEAHATNTGVPLAGLGSFKLDLDFHAQAQIDALGVIAAERGGFGGLELHANGSFQGIGLAVGLGYERVAVAPKKIHEGAYLHLGFQLRPLALAEEDAFRWFDPHIDLGCRLGGIGSDDGARFRAAMTIGAGFDVKLAPTDPHPVLNVMYRVEPLLEPTYGPLHLVLVGFGIRTAPD